MSVIRVISGEYRNQEVKIETTYGSMTFKSWPEAYEFRETIATWSGFTEATQPKTVGHAVAYHLAYVEGGFAWKPRSAGPAACS